jgi:hypothetical protein
VVAAAGVAAGIAAGVSAGAGDPVGAAGRLDAISRAGAPYAPRHARAAHAADHADSRSARAIATHAPPRERSRGKVTAPAQHPGRKAATTRQPARHGHPAVAPHPAQVAPAKPYLIYDSVLPTAIPADNMVATYATGPYAATLSQVAGRQVIWIDVYGTDYEASALDVEPTDATPDQAASWAYHRLSRHPTELAHIYTNISEWPQVQAACARLPGWMQSHIRWWIADPTGVPHVVPGSDATQWYWGSSYDISTATPRF